MGTSWGCVVLADAASMRPITVFRPYQDEVRAILTLWPQTQHSTDSSHGKDDSALTATTSTGAKSKDASSDYNCSNSSKSNINNNSKSNKKDVSHDSSTAASLCSSNKNEDALPNYSYQQQQQILSPTSQKSFSNTSNKSMSSFSLSSSSVTSSNSSVNLQQSTNALASNNASVESSVIDYSEINEAEEEDVFSTSGAAPVVATIGKGYRNLLARYAPMPKSAQQEASSRALYCLLWRANSWTD